MTAQDQTKTKEPKLHTYIVTGGYEETGTFEVEIEAEDADEAESEWSDEGHQVSEIWKNPNGGSEWVDSVKLKRKKKPAKKKLPANYREYVDENNELTKKALRQHDEIEAAIAGLMQNFVDMFGKNLVVDGADEDTNETIKNIRDEINELGIAKGWWNEIEFYPYLSED